MDTASPPVSPKVVATTLTIQNIKVTAGTLLSRADVAESVFAARFITLLASLG
jgi:hypothetical protein